jgi:hypothetical protein
MAVEFCFYYSSSLLFVNFVPKIVFYDDLSKTILRQNEKNIPKDENV